VELVVVVVAAVVVLWLVLTGVTGRASVRLRKPQVQAWKVYVWEWGPVGRQPAQFEALVNAVDEHGAAARARELLAAHRSTLTYPPATRCVPVSASLHEEEVLLPLHERDRSTLPPWAWPA
jgi:hypothetical protein